MLIAFTDSMLLITRNMMSVDCDNRNSLIDNRYSQIFELQIPNFSNRLSCLQRLKP